LICSSAAADAVLNVDQEKAALQAATTAYSTEKKLWEQDQEELARQQRQSQGSYLCFGFFFASLVSGPN